MQSSSSSAHTNVRKRHVTAEQMGTIKSVRGGNMEAVCRKTSRRSGLLLEIPGSPCLKEGGRYDFIRTTIEHRGQPMKAQVPVDPLNLR